MRIPLARVLAVPASAQSSRGMTSERVAFAPGVARSSYTVSIAAE